MVEIDATLQKLPERDTILIVINGIKCGVFSSLDAHNPAVHAKVKTSLTRLYTCSSNPWAKVPMWHMSEDGHVSILLKDLDCVMNDSKTKETSPKTPMMAQRDRPVLDGHVVPDQRVASDMHVASQEYVASLKRLASLQRLASNKHIALNKNAGSNNPITSNVATVEAVRNTNLRRTFATPYPNSLIGNFRVPGSESDFERQCIADTDDDWEKVLDDENKDKDAWQIVGRIP